MTAWLPSKRFALFSYIVRFYNIFVQIPSLSFHLWGPVAMTSNFQNPEKCPNFVKPALHMSKTCYISLTNVLSFAVQTKHFHWSSRHSCLGNCHVWKINIRKKTFTLHGRTQMVSINVAANTQHLISSILLWTSANKQPSFFYRGAFLEFYFFSKIMLESWGCGLYTSAAYNESLR